MITLFRLSQLLSLKMLEYLRVIIIFSSSTNVLWTLPFTSSGRESHWYWAASLPRNYLYSKKWLLLFVTNNHNNVVFPEEVQRDPKNTETSDLNRNSGYNIRTLAPRHLSVSPDVEDCSLDKLKKTSSSLPQYNTKCWH